MTGFTGGGVKGKGFTWSISKFIIVCRSYGVIEETEEGVFRSFLVVFVSGSDTIVCKTGRLILCKGGFFVNNLMRTLLAEGSV